MKGEVFVDAAEAGDEMIFEGSDGSFGGVAAMDIGWHKLVGDIFVIEKLLKRRRAFVVEALELWAEAGLAELGVEGFVGGKNGCGSASFHRFGEDAVAVVIIEDEKIVVAVA